MTHIKLGGAWRAAKDREEALERNARLLGSELDGVRALLDECQRSNLTLSSNVEDLKKRYALQRLKEVVLATALASERRKSLLREQDALVAIRSRDMMQVQLSKTQEQLIDTDRELREEIERRHEIAQHLDAMRSENASLQAQYDHIEERVEVAERESKAASERAQIMSKAKEQKEKHVCLLVKERDRLEQDLVKLRSELSKIKKTRSDRAAARGLVENRCPNASAVQKVADKETSKLAVFAGPNKVKQRLGKEIAMRKQAEQTINQLRQQILALRTRYRNVTLSQKAATPKTE